LEKHNLTLRDSRPEELDEVARLVRDAYRQYAPIMPSQAWQSYEADMMDVRSRLSESQLIVAELDGQLAGSVTLYPDASHTSLEGWPEGWGGVRLLAVHPKYRGRGIGRALMEECIRRCRLHGMTAIGLHTTEMMVVACRLYEEMGFVRIPEYDFHPGPGAVVMAYRLDLEL
jgi:GNAT superfamily N-acetyltransferase